MLERTVISVGSRELRARHLLVIAVLASSFTVSALIRAQPAEYGFELHEFDPFFNYRATEFLVENGLAAYGEWHDELSWHPDGRDISRTSQFMQHATAAALYGAFGGGSSLLDFVIVLPLVLGALTGVAVFALVRVIAGTTAGLLASLFYAVSVPIIIRGPIGWFKAEPIGLFYGVIGVYLFLSGITASGRREAALRLAGAGIVMSMALSAWGGTQFFIIPMGLFFMVLPFVRRDHSFLVWAVPLFVGVLLASSAAFERPGASFVLGLGGASLAVPAAVMVASVLIRRASPPSAATRNSLMLVLGVVAAAAAILAANSQAEYLDLPSFRYLNAVNPFLTTIDPLVDSVSEHVSLTLRQSFFFMSILMVFAGVGAWLLLSRRDRLDSYGIPLRTDMAVYAVIMGFAGVYVASAFTRLAVFSSVAMVVLASIGIAILASLVFSNARAGRGAKIGFVAVVVAMLLVPMTTPAEGNWVTTADNPPPILNGGSIFTIATQDWPLALEWLREETPPGSVVMSWWDYGYWIETLGERTTLVDNLTISTSKIQNIAQIFYSEPHVAWERMDELGVDYAVVYIAARNVGTPERPLYTLSGGGDETKRVWLARIAGVDEGDYLYGDSVSPRDKFDETLFGMMTPFSHVTYGNLATGLKSVRWQPGFVSIYEKDVRLPADGDGPLRLAYSSPSFDEDHDSRISGVFIYEVNRDYVPPEPEPVRVPISEIPFMEAALDGSQGDGGAPPEAPDSDPAEAPDSDPAEAPDSDPAEAPDSDPAEAPPEGADSDPAAGT